VRGKSILIIVWFSLLSLRTISVHHTDVRDDLRLRAYHSRATSSMKTLDGIVTLSELFRHTALVAAMIILAGRNTFAQPSPHGTLVEPCESCHVSDSWTTPAHPLLFGHDTRPAPVPSAREMKRSIRHTPRRRSSAT